jgi:uncharacterized membrane-anchored protein YitT (DUF2179 family)
MGKNLFLSSLRQKFPKLKLPDWKSALRDYALIVVGAAVGSFGLVAFLVPHKIAPGGIGGLATALHHLWGLPVGLTMLVFNVPLFLVGLRFLGGSFGPRTVAGIVLYSLFADLYGEIVRIGPLTDDTVMAMIYGAVLLGLGLGLVLRGGGSTGGTDIPARVLSRCTGLSTGVGFLVFDSLIISFAGVVFREIDLVLYGFLALGVSVKVIDVVLDGFSYARAALIVTDVPDIVYYQIMAGLNRGATLMQGRGMYTDEERNVIYCVIEKREVERLKRLVKLADSRAFVVITDVHEVLGYGFRRRGSA